MESPSKKPEHPQFPPGKVVTWWVTKKDGRGVERRQQFNGTVRYQEGGFVRVKVGQKEVNVPAATLERVY